MVSNAASSREREDFIRMYKDKKVMPTLDAYETKFRTYPRSGSYVHQVDAAIRTLMMMKHNVESICSDPSFLDLKGADMAYSSQLVEGLISIENESRVIDALIIAQSRANWGKDV